VEATDASAQQIANAIAHARVRYAVMPAEATSFADRSFDAISVAQAIHWFDLERFYAEAKRVLRPGGVIAVSGYDWAKVTPEVDFALERHLLAKIKAHWPKQTEALQRGYRDLPCPFEPIAAPRLRIEMRWTAEQYLAYAETWTATRAYVAQHGPAILGDTLAALKRAWGGAGERPVTMALHLRIGRNA
jgi:SAM-dependent methyltransferase